MSSRNKILLLTLVHPDFLPPVYATAQVLRDEGYSIHIVTFESLVRTENEITEGITICEVGKYHERSFFQKSLLRRKFYAAAINRVREQPEMIISFCSFSFLCAEAIKGLVPHAYIALEIDNIPETFRESPLTFMRIRRTFKKISGAELVATPSLQRSAWLAGRCGLRNLPFTIQNAAYYRHKTKLKSTELPNEVIPSHFFGKQIFLYTGRISNNYSVHEIVKAFGQLDNGNAALVITGFRDNDPYCLQLARIVEEQPNRENILLLPVVPRNQLVELQGYANVGICFLQERKDALDTQMAAPNKIGEYIANGLYLLTNKSVYTSQFENAGIASLVDEPTVNQIRGGMVDALNKINAADFAERVESFFHNEYCMQRQARPIIEFLNNRKIAKS